MVADARALTSWRRWGYRLLPGDLFSYVLHLRPAEWPIMAAHTLLGYVLAVGIGEAVRGARLPQAIGALVVWVVFLNGGTLAINSVFDKDEGDIGYLRAPPPPPRHLLGFSAALLAGGQLLSVALPPAFRIDYAICLVLSILYSVPPFRFKAVAGVDWVINMWGFGTLTPFAAWAATGRPLDLAHGLVLLGFCPLFAGLYPLTQLYQMEEDRRRGDRTLALMLGMRASLAVANWKRSPPHRRLCVAARGAADPVARRAHALVQAPRRAVCGGAATRHVPGARRVGRHRCRGAAGVCPLRPGA